MKQRARDLGTGWRAKFGPEIEESGRTGLLRWPWVRRACSTAK
jgi:hypothetical protein